MRAPWRSRVARRRPALGRPVLLDQQTSPLSQTDKESIATDPVKPRLAYSAWERLQIPPTLFPFRGPAMFSRTTDAGRTWEPARVLYDPGANALTINHQLFREPTAPCTTSLPRSG